MKSLARLVSVILALGWSSAWAQFPNNPTFTTYFIPGALIEGLTGDDSGNFYVADRATDVCNVWKINTNSAAPNSVKVGDINVVGCAPSGLTFDRNGNLYITNDSTIYKLTPDELTTPHATLFAEGVPGANGVAFTKQGYLLVTDATENQGRVWKIGPAGGTCEPMFMNCEEFFRIPPRRNGTALGGNVTAQPDGVGSVRYTVPRFAIDVCDNTAMPPCPPFLDRQDIVANGIALSVNGKYISGADTARGAIWRAELKPNGDLKSATGCDPTLTADTLCMDSLWVAHPLLEGVDGIILLRNGTILADVNERNAIVAIAPDKTVTEVFQNPVNANLLRNEGPLAFPTSPFVSGKKFCTTNANFPRRDNNPNSQGPKVTCVDQNLKVPGLPLPVQ